MSGRDDLAVTPEAEDVGHVTDCISLSHGYQTRVGALAATSVVSVAYRVVNQL